MGSQVQKQAALLGLTKFRLTTLYAQPRRYRLSLMTMVPDVADIIRDYINLRDPSFIQDRSGGGRNNSFYYLSQKAEIYVEVFDQLVAYVARGSTPQDRVNRINIFCDNEEDIRGIAQAIARGENRVQFLARLDWKKIEDRFRVNKDDCIVEWKKWLSPLSAIELASLPASRPPAVKRETVRILQYIFNIAAVFFLVVWVIVLVLGMMQWASEGDYYDSWAGLAIFFNVYFWVGLGCAITGSMFSFKKTKAEQFILEQRLLFEEK